MSTNMSDETRFYYSQYTTNDSVWKKETSATQRVEKQLKLSQNKTSVSETIRKPPLVKA